MGVELEDPATDPTSPLEELVAIEESLELSGDSVPAELELVPAASSIELELMPPLSGPFPDELQAFSRHSFVVHCAADDNASSPHAQKPKATTATGTRFLNLFILYQPQQQPWIQQIVVRKIIYIQKSYSRCNKFFVVNTTTA
jgi:hypothetical protein